MRAGLVVMVVPALLGLDPRVAMAAAPPPPRSEIGGPRRVPPPPSSTGRAESRAQGAGSGGGGASASALIEGPVEQSQGIAPPLRLELPEARHRRRGLGLLAGAGVSLGASLGLGWVALRGVERQCIGPLAAAGGEISQQRVDLCVAARPEIVWAGAGSGLALAMGVGLGAGAGWELGLARGAEAGESSRRARLGLGALLLTAGIGGVIASRLALRVGWACEEAACLEEMRRVDLGLRTVAAGMVIGGGGLLASIAGARRRAGPMERRALRVVPQIAAGGGGVKVSGRF